MRNLKKMFRVTGSETLRKAFSEELNNLGFRNEGSSDGDHIAVYGGLAGYHYNYRKSCTDHVGKKIYVLPQDWDKALAAAQDYEEVWPKYIKCLETSSGGYSKDKIYVAHRGTDKDYFTTLDDYGSTTNGWCKHKFKEVTKEEYDLQEAKPVAGDYVIMVSERAVNNSSYRIGDIFQVNHTYKSGLSDIDSWIFDADYDNGRGMSIRNVRKATPQEIKEATEIKAGDIVIALQNVSYLFKGELATIRSIEDTHVKFSHNKDSNDFAGCSPVSDFFRKATAAELKVWDNVKISGYNAEVADGKIKFGCQRLSKTTLQELHSIAGHVDIKIGDTDITQHLLTKLISKL